MNVEFAVEIYRTMFSTAALVAAPVLLTAMAVGLSVSLLQTLTSIQEQTLTFVPKAAAIALVLGLGMPWFLAQLMHFLQIMLTMGPVVAGRGSGP